jgi:hypothetical protein
MGILESGGNFFGGLGGKVGSAAEKGGSFFTGLGGKAGAAVEKGGGFLDGKFSGSEGVSFFSSKFGR